MTDHAIPNALTDAEWAARRCGDMRLYELFPGRVSLEIGLEEYEYGVSLDEPAEYAAVMALANAALPDGDQRKITRWDVEIILAEAEALERMLHPADHPSPLRPIAAKLAAILPPEAP